MNMLQDSKSVNSPDDKKKPKTPLRKDELEKIAQELKKKLARASVAAKQLLGSGRSGPPDSPVSLTLFPKSSPLKNYYMWKRQIASSGASLGLLPNLISPQHAPLASLPTGETDDEQSPTKKRRAEPQMVLRELPRPLTPGKSAVPAENSQGSPDAAAVPQVKVTTPTLAKKQLNLLKTPTQPRRESFSGGGADTEGADLLMYLATSPSPAKPFATPRAATASQAPQSKPGQFVAPMTPKRAGTTLAKTPQNRFTPALYGNVVPGSALPLAGLALTPAGFNMSDYVNFFTPSPSGSAAARNLMKTPDFHNAALLLKLVDGKMINFDKVGLFGPKE